jgi:hypothetical protein
MRGDCPLYRCLRSALVSRFPLGHAGAGRILWRQVAARRLQACCTEHGGWWWWWGGGAAGSHSPQGLRARATASTGAERASARTAARATAPARAPEEHRPRRGLLSGSGAGRPRSAQGLRHGVLPARAAEGHGPRRGLIMAQFRRLKSMEHVRQLEVGGDEWRYLGLAEVSPATRS